MKIKDEIKMIRMGLGYTLKELAKKFRVTDRTVWNWEHGVGSGPSAKDMDRLRAMFKTAFASEGKNK